MVNVPTLLVHILYSGASQSAPTQMWMIINSQSLVRQIVIQGRSRDYTNTVRRVNTSDVTLTKRLTGTNNFWRRECPIWGVPVLRHAAEYIYSYGSFSWSLVALTDTQCGTQPHVYRRMILGDNCWPGSPAWTSVAPIRLRLCSYDSQESATHAGSLLFAN